jgi:hypothetical protein
VEWKRCAATGGAAIWSCAVYGRQCAGQDKLSRQSMEQQATSADEIVDFRSEFGE